MLRRQFVHTSSACRVEFIYALWVLVPCRVEFIRPETLAKLFRNRYGSS
jgi:hypothetical protein